MHHPPSTRSRMNRYDGYVDQWKVSLALGRIKAFGFQPDQWSDILQDLMPKIARFRFQANRAGGRNEAQVLYGLVNNHLRSVFRVQQREQSRVLRHHELLGVSPTKAESHPLFAASINSAMQVDIDLALTQLPERERSICQRLMLGHSLTQICQDLKLHLSTVKTCIARVRELFSKLELNAWLLK